MKVKLKAGAIEVVKRMENGAALVRVPIAPSAVVDLSKTASTMKGEVAFDGAMFSEMVANFDLRGRPVTVGFDGINSDGHARNPDGPQAAFIESLEVEDGTLYAVIRLNPFGATVVIDDEAFQGFSIEASRDVETPTETLAGWVLTGGVFTNNPATPTHFRKIAATSETKAAEVVAGFTSFSADLTEGEGGLMPEQKTEEKVTLAFHNAKVGEVKDTLAAVTAEKDSAVASLTAMRAENATLATKNGELGAEVQSLTNEKLALTASANRLTNQLKTQTDANAAMAAELTEVKQKAEATENESLAGKVTAVIHAAIDKGVKPAAFGDWEGDPAAWMKANFVNFDAFDRQTANLCGAIGASQVVTAKSGHDPKTENPNEPAISDDLKAVIKRNNLGGVNFIGCKTAEEAEARIAAAKAKE